LKTRQIGTTSPPLTLQLGELPQAVGYALRRSQMTVFADFQHALARVHLRPQQYGVLVVIGENPGLSQTEVCKALGFQQANLVALVNTFVRRGVAERRRSTRDARSSALFLTAAGLRLLAEARRLWRQHERRMVDRIGPQGRDQLLGLLQALMSAP
jgi:DNA-binding MarR family transcriptional regulator